MKSLSRNLKILFIGNSHTYLHKMPGMIAALASADHRGSCLYAQQCTGNGVNLQWHWQSRATRDAIAAGSWDYVVLQDRSGGPLAERDLFERHAALLDGEIKTQGAATLFYMTWAKRSRPGDQWALAEAYTDTARRLGAGLVPVGLAWQNAIHEAPDVDLFHPDGRHAGSAGAYLAACVFYAVLFNRTPEGLPSAITVDDKQRVKLDPDRALQLQRIAFHTVQDPPPDSQMTPLSDQPESESGLGIIRQHMTSMGLESIAAAGGSDSPSALRSDLDAAAEAFREKARHDRARGALHSALRLERRAWALDVFKIHGLDAARLIRSVDFSVGYSGKILMVRITGEWVPEPGRVCLRSGDDWHHEILKNTEAEMQDLGFETAIVTPVGGAWVRFETDDTIVVYGTSDAYGACDKANAARLITRAFPGRTVTIRD